MKCWYCNPAQAPYGLLWHIVAFPLIPSFILLTALVDVIALRTIAKYKAVFITYYLCSAWIWLQAPYDLPILWITLLGLWKKPLVLLAPIAKIPFETILLKPSVWKFVTTRPFILTDLQYYLLMGCVFIVVLLRNTGEAMNWRFWNRKPKPVYPISSCPNCCGRSIRIKERQASMCQLRSHPIVYRNNQPAKLEIVDERSTAIGSEWYSLRHYNDGTWELLDGDGLPVLQGTCGKTLAEDVRAVSRREPAK